MRLRPFVTGYADFDMAGWPPGRHRGLPDAGLTMVISFGAPLVIRRAGHADLATAASVAGLRSAPFDICHDGTQRGVQVELTPRGCRALLGRPAGELVHGVWPLEQVVGRRREGELTGTARRGPGAGGSGPGSRRRPDRVDGRRRVPGRDRRVLARADQLGRPRAGDEHRGSDRAEPPPSR